MSFGGSVGGVPIGGVVAADSRPLEESIAELLSSEVEVETGVGGFGTAGKCEYIGEFVALANAAESAR